VSLTARLAAFFRAHPGEWVDGRRLAAHGGSYAWRSRVAELRHPPHNLNIVNRQRRVQTESGRVTVSEYMLVVEKLKTEGGATAGGCNAGCRM
jgi:hypothetical protein